MSQFVSSNNFGWIQSNLNIKAQQKTHHASEHVKKNR